VPEKNRALITREYGSQIILELPLSMMFCLGEGGAIRAVRAEIRGCAIEAKMVFHLRQPRENKFEKDKSRGIVVKFGKIDQRVAREGRAIDNSVEKKL